MLLAYAAAVTVPVEPPSAAGSRPKFTSPTPPVSIALLGHGTVGRGVVRLLTDAGGDLSRRTGAHYELRHVVVRDPARHADVAAALPLTTDAIAAVTDSAVDVVIELVGGVDLARQYVVAALEAGKSVVTANKALVAAHGPELFELARENNVALAFEASCGGGIPIIGALTNGLLANEIQALVGILNGTSNFILSRMTDGGDTYDAALAEAQRLGFAEADPTLDVNGRDVAQKLSILAGLAFGERVDEKTIHVEGIAGLAAEDIAFAGELGYVVKLLATATRNEEGRVSLSVFPGLVAAGDPLADVKGPFNAVATYGHALGRSLFVGRGAGQMPTASAVVADLLSLTIGGHAELFRRLNVYPDRARPADVIDFEQTEHRYYLRIVARDVPGVMADLTRCLGSAGISLSAILQRDAHGGEFVPVVVTTHLAREGSLRRAVEAINALASVRDPATLLRIVEMPQEVEGVTA